MKKIVWLLAFATLAFTGCKLDSVDNSSTSTTTTVAANPNQPAIDDAAIQAYLTTNKTNGNKRCIWFILQYCFARYRIYANHIQYRNGRLYRNIT